MGLKNNIRKTIGFVTVQIEGFFTERFINLCRINNIKIWDIRNIVKGVIRFKIDIYDFKKLRKIARKTKCKVTVKSKKGIYFTLFKYRKRKLVFVLITLVIIASITASTFIWDIEISGNSTLSNEQIIEGLKECGIYIGKNKIGVDTKKVVTDLRIKLNDISWAGLQIEGTKVKLEIVEKTKLDEKDKQNMVNGNIVASKSGIITKIVPENGTAVFKVGSYVEKGDILIEGVLYSKYIDPILVPPKGIVKADCEYIYENEYKYEKINKNKTGKVRYTVGVTVNSNENMLNYLNKNKKYDITKSSKNINVFGNNISFDIYRCEEYEEEKVQMTKEELIELGNIDVEKYIQDELLKNSKEGTLVEKNMTVTDTEDGIKIVTRIVINEEIGNFVEGETRIREQNKEGE